MNKRMSLTMLAALLAALLWATTGAMAQQNNAPGASNSVIPTFSTDQIGRQGHFYVGGHYVGEPGKETMDGAMYVEVWVPKTVRHPYPVVFITGSVGQGAYELIQTPDGRPGWAYDFVNQGYTVYMMDFPAHGRSQYVPGVDGTVTPPRSGPLMEEVWSGGRAASTPQSDWPQARKQTQWPGSGKMGDPTFDYYAKTEVHGVSGGPRLEKIAVEDIEELIDRINQPVILLLHSGLAATGWVVADSRHQMIKGIIAAEPVAPPIENAERGSTGLGRAWGISNSFLHYDPPIKEASELQTVRQDTSDAPDLIPCWVQKEPAHKLINLENIPVLDVSGEASYHRPYAHCVPKWLNQAGVKTTYVRLEDVGLPGNGHQFMSEKNSAEIAKFFMDWLDRNAH